MTAMTGRCLVPDVFAMRWCGAMVWVGPLVRESVASSIQAVAQQSTAALWADEIVMQEMYVFHLHHPPHMVLVRSPVDRVLLHRGLEGEPLGVVCAHCLYHSVPDLVPDLVPPSGGMP